jgi:tetratricopeptide (TPR) repeat protein
MRQPTKPEEPLTPAGEAEWARWRKHLEMADGFWLAFVFARSSGGVHVFEQRTEQVLRLRARRQVVLAPSTPAELESVAIEVLARAEPEHRDSAALGCIWIEAVFADRPGMQDGRWTDAWDQALLTLNQARQPLRHRLSAGLVIATSAHLKPRVRAAAPDLWSIRTLVLDLPAAPAPPPSEGERQLEAADDREQRTEGVLMLGGRAGRIEGSADDDSARALIEQLREIERLASNDRIAEALELGHEAVAQTRARGHDALLTAALAVVAAVEEAAGDAAAATQHLEEAVGHMDDETTAPLLVELLGRLGALMLVQGNPDYAVEVFERQVALMLPDSEALDATPERTGELAMSLERLGEAQEVAGDLQAATIAYEESHTLRQRILDTYGETPQTLRDLAISLERLAQVGKTRGGLKAGPTA